MFNCIVIDDEELARSQLQEYVDKVPFFRLLGCFESPLDTLKVMDEVDVVFSDINMPDMDGISFIKSLKRPPVFVFVTGNARFAVESFELDVLDFLVKPFDFARFMKAANKSKEYLLTKAAPTELKSFIIVKDRNLNLVLDFADIVFIKANRDYVHLQTVEKGYTLWRTLGSMENELPKNTFMRVHKSYIVNLGFVKSISSDRIITKGNIENIPIGKQYKDQVFTRFGIT